MYEKVIKQFNDIYFNESPKKKAYSLNHIFDEEKSVKWNRAEVLRINDEIKEHNIKIREQRFRALAEAHNNIINYLKNEYFTLPRKKIENLYHHIYEEIFENDYRIKDVIDEVEEILDIFSEEE